MSRIFRQMNNLSNQVNGKRGHVPGQFKHQAQRENAKVKYSYR